MRLLSARLIISLVVGVTLVSLCSSYYQSYVLARGMRRDLEHRAELLGESLAETSNGILSALIPPSSSALCSNSPIASTWPAWQSMIPRESPSQ